MEAEKARGKHVEKIGFRVGKYPVKQAEWTAVVGEKPFRYQKDGKSEWARKLVVDLDTREFPAESVSWDVCQDFLGKVSGRARAEKVFGEMGQVRVAARGPVGVCVSGRAGKQTGVLLGG